MSASPSHAYLSSHASRSGLPVQLLLPTYLSSTDPYTLMLDRRHAHTAVRARRKHHHQPIIISRHPAIAHWRAHHIPPWYKGPYKAKPIRTRGTHSPRYTQPQHSTASTRIQPQQRAWIRALLPPERDAVQRKCASIHHAASVRQPSARQSHSPEHRNHSNHSNHNNRNNHNKRTLALSTPSTDMSSPATAFP